MWQVCARERVIGVAKSRRASGSPFHGEEKERGGEKAAHRVCARKALPKTIDGGIMRNRVLQVFTNSGAEILRFWKSSLLTGLDLGRWQSSWGEGGGPSNRQWTVCCGDPCWVALGEKVPLPGVHLEDGILPRDERPRRCLWATIQQRDRGVHSAWIEWSQLFAVRHHKLQAPAQLCNCFLGQNGTRCSASALLLWRELGDAIFLHSPAESDFSEPHGALSQGRSHLHQTPPQKRPRHHSRVHPAHTGNTSWSSRPWRAYNPFLV